MGLLIVNLNASRNVAVTPALMHTVATALSEEGGTSLPGGCLSPWQYGFPVGVVDFCALVQGLSFPWSDPAFMVYMHTMHLYVD